MIELFTIVVGTQMMLVWHWRCEAFAVLHTELLQAIFEIPQRCTEEIQHARLQRRQNSYAHKWPSVH